MIKSLSINPILLIIFIFHAFCSSVSGENIYTYTSDYNEFSERSDWKNIKSVEDLWESHPDKMRHLFSGLNFQYPGLEPVEKALNSADTIAAGKALVSYYKNAETAGWLRDVDFEEFSGEERLLADQLLDNMFTRRGVTARIPQKENGGLDWTFIGPDKDDEFGYTLNRHPNFPHLLKGWHVTGNEAYAEKFDLTIRDWILHNPLPDEDHLIWEVHRTTTAELDYRDIGEVIWRTLDSGIRIGESWLDAFFGFQQSESFTPAARLLMLYSISVHAEYLKEYHQEFHNWTTMEMNGLGLIGLSFPEFKKAADWENYALQVMEKEINSQVYPDGVQAEICTNTQWVSLKRFELLVENFNKAGRVISDDYLKRVEIMYDYLAYSMRPSGHQPLNADSDREDVRPRILRAAEVYNRPDWTYIATNGERGTRPEGLPTRVYPWAGLHVMRNGWDSLSHWAFFHNGPYGIGHQHRDDLHISIHAYGRDLLVDGGRYTYDDYFNFDPATWRGYFRSSFSQNLVLVDGAGQNEGPLFTETPQEKGVDYLNTPELDFAKGTFSSGFEGVEGEVEHTRAVVYVKGKYWVVVDRVTTDRPRKLETLWHFAPDVRAVTEAGQIVSNDAEKGNLRIVPVGEHAWEVNIIQGQTEPFNQGWYSDFYGQKQPNPTAIYTANIDGDATFAWVLVPANGRVPAVSAEITDSEAVIIRVQPEGEEPAFITVPLNSGQPELQ